MDIGTIIIIIVVGVLLILVFYAIGVYNNLINARNKVAQQVNETLVDTYWNIGKVIVEKEQSGQIKAEYGKSVLLNVSKRLSKEIEKGFSKSNLFNMRNSI